MAGPDVRPRPELAETGIRRCACPWQTMIVAQLLDLHIYLISRTTHAKPRLAAVGHSIPRSQHDVGEIVQLITAPTSDGRHDVTSDSSSDCGPREQDQPRGLHGALPPQEYEMEAVP
jgi:hypothetical protein